MTLTRTVLVPSNEAEWLDFRTKDITSTEAAALFGAGSYIKTPYELYHRKTGAVADDFTGSDRTRWGNRLEAPIAYGIAEDLGLIVEPFKTYIRIEEARMGASFDFRIVGLAEGYSGDETYRDLFREHGHGIMEVKNVDGLQFRRAWLDDGETIEAPLHIEFQVQHQLEVADLNWSIIAPLVGGNTPRPIFRLRDRATGEALRAKAAELWAQIAAGTPPAPDYSKDGKTIAKVYVENDGSAVDLSDNPRVSALCRAYKKAAAEESDAKKKKDAAKAELLTILKAAKSVTAVGFKISAGTNKASFRAYVREGYEKITITLTEIPSTQIEAEVPAYRNVRISEVAA